MSKLSGMEVGGKAWRATAVLSPILKTLRYTSTTRFVYLYLCICISENNNGFVANFESTAVYFFNNKVCRILNDCGTEL